MHVAAGNGNIHIHYQNNISGHHHHVIRPFQLYTQTYISSLSFRHTHIIHNRGGSPSSSSPPSNVKMSILPCLPLHCFTSLDNRDASSPLLLLLSSFSFRLFAFSSFYLLLLSRHAAVYRRRQEDGEEGGRQGMYTQQPCFSFCVFSAGTRK